MCKSGDIIRINDLISYYINPAHRVNNNRVKSFWLIKPNVERNYFVTCFNNGWFVNTKGWGLYRHNGSLRLLGKDREKNESKIGVFVTHNNNINRWHGYPYERINPGDKPMDSILILWKNIELINKSQMKKLKKGKVCNL